MVVAVCRLSLYFPESGSLKQKRQGLRRLIERVRAKFNVSIAEVAEQDIWQRGTVAFSVISTSSDHAQSMIDKISDFAEQLYVAQILDREVDLLNYSDEERMGDLA